MINARKATGSRTYRVKYELRETHEMYITVMAHEDDTDLQCRIDRAVWQRHRTSAWDWQITEVDNEKT